MCITLSFLLIQTASLRVSITMETTAFLYKAQVCVSFCLMRRSHYLLLLCIVLLCIVFAVPVSVVFINLSLLTTALMGKKTQESLTLVASLNIGENNSRPLGGCRLFLPMHHWLTEGLQLLLLPVTFPCLNTQFFRPIMKQFCILLSIVYSMKLL